MTKEELNKIKPQMNKADQKNEMGDILETIRNVMNDKSPSVMDALDEHDNIASNNVAPKDDWEEFDKIIDLVDKIEEDGTIKSLTPFQSQQNANSLDIENSLTSRNANLEIADLSSLPSTVVDNPTNTEQTIINDQPNQTIMNNDAQPEFQEPIANFNFQMGIDQPNIEQNLKRSNNLSNLNSTESLLSEATIQETTDTFRNLINQVTKPINNSGITLRKGMAIEDLVIEALKPPLAEWLDKHLPNIVKTLVEKEIKKLIPNDDNIQQ